MQTIEKALHQPMPFTTGGQTITDRLTAAKHSLAGSQLGKTICKATTEELMAPKKKHLDYLLHCTQEPNVSIPSMANLLIERTQNPNWTVVYKALITIHNIMCYGNERFSQYLASCNTTFNLGSFLDKNTAQGYDMSQHVRRYGKYISEKIYTYRLCAFDFCKVKRGREDGLLRTMNTDKLLKTLPILQNQIDALLEFQVTSAELNNGVINCSFILLFRDLIRLFACYNDGVINLLEKYFDMNKKQCREALDAYKSFLLRLDKVANFLKVAESVGIDRTEIPDLTRAPASLLEALEAHLIHLEGGKAPPSIHHEQFTAAMAQSAPLFSSAQTGVIDDSAKQKYLEEEKERLRLFEEQRKRQATAAPGSSAATDTGHSFNPFATPASQASTDSSGRPLSAKPSDDLLSLFDPMPVVGGAPATAAPAYGAASVAPVTAAPQPLSLDPTNPFSQNSFQQQQQQQPTSIMPANSSAPDFTLYPNVGTTNAFGADFSSAFSGGVVATTAAQEGAANMNAYGTQPPSSVSPATSQAGKFASGDLDSALSSLADNLSVNPKGATNQGKPVQWNSQSGIRPAGGSHPITQPHFGAIPPQQWPPMGVYAPQPGMYAQQPIMGMYGQPGYNPQTAAAVYGIAPGQTQPQVGQSQQTQPQRPFI